MPLLRGQRPEKRENCPDAESLCALAENRASGTARAAIEEHLKHCSKCAELHERLLDFARPNVAVDAKEWAGAEKRLGNWMEGMLKAERRRAAAAAGPAAPRTKSAWGWSESWKAAWALGVAAILVTVAVVYVYHPWNSKSATQVALNPSPTAAPEAVPEAPIPGAQTPSPQVAQNPASSGANKPGSKSASPSGGAQAGTVQPDDVVPLAADVPNRDSSHNNLRGAPSENLPPARQSTTKAASAISPDTKTEIAEDVRVQLSADKDASAHPGEARGPRDGGIPSALSPARTIFAVSNVESVQTAEGQTCSLTPGDVVRRLGTNPDAEQNVTAQVTASKSGDCSSGARVMISAQELEEMHNDMRVQIDSGLETLAENAHDNGLPAGPALGRVQNRDGVAEPQPGAADELDSQQVAADDAEDEVQETMDFSPPSAVRRSDSLPAKSTANGKFDRASVELPKTIREEYARLSLVAWKREFNTTESASRKRDRASRAGTATEAAARIGTARAKTAGADYSTRCARGDTGSLQTTCRSDSNSRRQRWKHVHNSGRIVLPGIGSGSAYEFADAQRNGGAVQFRRANQIDSYGERHDD